MPRFPVIAACVLTIVLALAMVWVQRGGSTGDAGPVVLVPLAPSEIATISAVGPDGSRDSIGYEPGIGRWVIESGGVAWPADDGRARGGLRLFGRLSGVPAEATGDEDWTRTFELTASDGRTWAVSFGPPAVGGTGLVRVTAPDGSQQAALVSGDVVGVGLAGLGGWRAEAAIPLGGASPMRLELAGGGAAVSLQSGERGWTVVQPVFARAHSESIAAVVGSLGSMKLSPGVESEGVAQAAVAMAVRRDQGRTLAWQLEFLGESGLDGGATRVRASGALYEADGSVAVGFGPVFGTVDREAAAAVVVAPEPYLARTALDASAASVSLLHVTPPVWEGAGPTPDSTVGVREGVIRLVRTRDGWSVENAGGDWDARIGSRLVTLVTESPAGESLLAQPAGFEPLALVQPAGGDGVPVGAVAVGVRMVEGSADAWVLVSGPTDTPVFRVYPLTPGTAEIDGELIRLLQAAAEERVLNQPAG